MTSHHDKSIRIERETLVDRTIQNPIEAKFHGRAFVSAERDGYFGRCIANRDMHPSAAGGLFGSDPFFGSLSLDHEGAVVRYVEQGTTIAATSFGSTRSVDQPQRNVPTFMFEIGGFVVVGREQKCCTSA